MIHRFIVLLFVLVTIGCESNAQNEYQKIRCDSSWKLRLDDSCTRNWQQNWFLDGVKAQINQDNNGMDFIAGPINRNNAHHAVLWTKQSFEGDVKIEYNYTRTDSQVINVNIIYIQGLFIKF